MDRFALRSVNFALFAAAFGCSTAALAQDVAPPAAAPEAPAAEAPAAPPVAAEPPPAAPMAEPAPVAAELPPPEPAAAKPKPPPYSLPWQLRPAVVGNVVRSDTAFAFYKDAAGKESGYSVASMLLFSYKLSENFAPLIRLGVAGNAPPLNVKASGVDIDRAQNFLNPVIGATYAMKPAKPLRLAFFLGVTLPIGGGGGDNPDVSNAQANAPYGIRARSAMDNAMFSVNDFTIFPGVDLAYVASGFTIQVEATLLQLMRVKGDAGPKPKNPDKSKTNLTMGLHVGYFIIPQLSIGAEIRHQRFLSTPQGVKDDNAAAAPLGVRDQTTWAIGPRGHFKLGESVWFRPGVAFSMPIDDPMSKFKYKVVQLDLPVAF
jgi:hypothetical protein